MKMQPQLKVIFSGKGAQKIKIKIKSRKTERYLSLFTVTSRKDTVLLWTSLWEAVFTFSGTSYFVFNIFKHILVRWCTVTHTKYSSLNWKCKVMLSKCELFSWTSLFGYEIINLCSFSLTCFWSPEEAILSLHKMLLHWAASRANNKSDQSSETWWMQAPCKNWDYLEKKRLRE